MSEFSHIEVTIENVDTDGNRTRPTRWSCPSVEMGCTRDSRVQLWFAGEPVVIGGEKPDTVTFTVDLGPIRATIDEIARMAESLSATTCAPAFPDTCATEAPVQYPGWTRTGDAVRGWVFVECGGNVRQVVRFEPGATEEEMAEILGVTEAPRNVATDPQPGDMAIVRMATVTLTYKVDCVTEAGTVEVSVLNVHAMPRRQTFTRIGWDLICAMAADVIPGPGAAVPPERDPAREPE